MDITNTGLIIFATASLAAAVAQLPLTIEYVKEWWATRRPSTRRAVQRRLNQIQGDFTPCPPFVAPNQTHASLPLLGESQSLLPGHTPLDW